MVGSAEWWLLWVGCCVCWAPSDDDFHVSWQADSFGLVPLFAQILLIDYAKIKWNRIKCLPRQKVKVKKKIKKNQCKVWTAKCGDSSMDTRQRNRVATHLPSPNVRDKTPKSIKGFPTHFPSPSPIPVPLNFILSHITGIGSVHPKAIGWNNGRAKPQNCIVTWKIKIPMEGARGTLREVGILYSMNFVRVSKIRFSFMWRLKGSWERIPDVKLKSLFKTLL